MTLGWLPISLFITEFLGGPCLREGGILDAGGIPPSLNLGAWRGLIATSSGRDPRT